MTPPMTHWHDVIRAIYIRAGVFNTQPPHTDGIKKRKTDTVLNDETSEIERDLCAFGSIWGGGGGRGVRNYAEKTSAIKEGFSASSENATPSFLQDVSSGYNQLQ